MIDETILRDFGLIWPRHVSGLTQFLIQCRHHFDGDIDLFVVFCVVGDRMVSGRGAPRDIDFDGWNKINLDTLPTEDINVQSIADFSSIPRETVRRKLNILVEKGWVARNERGFVVATEKAKTDLAPLTLAGLTYLSKMKTVLSPS